MRGRTHCTRPTRPKFPAGPNPPGFNIGGPLKIPHIYDGSDKTFFYHQFWRHVVAQSGGLVRNRADAGRKKWRFQRGQCPALRSVVKPDRPEIPVDQYRLLPGHAFFAAASRGHLHSHEHDQPAVDQSVELHSLAEYSRDERCRAEFQLSPADESAGLQQSAECERHAPAHLEAEPGGELQPHRRDFALPEQFSRESRETHSRAGKA